MRTQIETSAAPPASGPYSQAIRAGNLVFAAGQLGADPTSGELAEGVAAQADRALLNLAAVLDAAGASLDRVVKTTVFLSDMASFATVNEAYARHFSAPYPARSTVAVRELPRGGLVEIECIAIASDAA
ncbi:MAG TPA: Rid family detoxifying hydrolase [Candidatus Limnocylindria bacterium]|nr:Rid family detoxifying hydrolase [Candidatus Limnocylindria bacterium]